MQRMEVFSQVALKSPSQLPCPYGTVVIWILETDGIECERYVSKRYPRATRRPLRRSYEHVTDSDSGLCGL